MAEFKKAIATTLLWFLVWGLLNVLTGTPTDNSVILTTHQAVQIVLNGFLSVIAAFWLESR